jgi:hypothetical protein
MPGSFTPRGWLPLKLPYGCLRGGRSQGEQSVAVLLPLWIPQGVRLCALHLTPEIEHYDPK